MPATSATRIKTQGVPETLRLGGLRCRRVRWELTGTEAFLKLLEQGRRLLPTNEKNYGPRCDRGWREGLEA